MCNLVVLGVNGQLRHEHHQAWMDMTHSPDNPLDNLSHMCACELIEFTMLLLVLFLIVFFP